MLDLSANARYHAEHNEIDNKDKESFSRRMDRLLLALRALGPARILALFLGVAAIIAMLGMVGSELSKPGLTLLYGGLNPDEAAGMSQWLESQGVDYEVKNDGSVYVPSTQVGELRLQAAGNGLVGSSTTGYEIFDKSSGFGTTSFVQNINARRALEGELARTIATLPAVSNARVHLVLPQHRLFEQETASPSAAVALNLSGRLLGNGQVENIARLVGSAVPNLSLENITVIDQAGNLLFDGADQATSGAMLTSHRQQTIEKDMEKRLTSMLEKVVGPNKVSVKVSAQVNGDHIEEQSEIFDPQQQVVRSEQRVEENNSSNQSSPAGTVGLTGNIPGEAAGGGAANTSQDNKQRTEETINYEITRTIRNLVRDGGDIERLSVAVLIEGKYLQEEGEEKPVYQSYSEDEIERFTTLIKTAMGYNEERGDTVEVVDMPFSQMPEMEEYTPPFMTKQDIFLLIKYLIVFVGLILIIFMVIRPALNAFSKAVHTVSTPGGHPGGASAGPGAAHMTIAGASGGEGGGSEGPDETISIDKVEGRVRESMIKQVNEVIDQHPEESLAVVRGWMAETD